ncbi:MAG TPA: hypothetical protein VIK01_07630 [Polyangiaceae bacterium]
MKHLIKAKISVFGTALLLGFASLGFARTAAASPDYPSKLQAWMEKKFSKTVCAPQCSACHLTNLGGLGMLNVFGANLKKYGNLIGIPNDANFSSEVDAYFAAVAAGTANGDSDGDGVPDLTELAQGDSPAVALPLGKSLLCPDIEYGCAGGRIAAAPPPVDCVALFSGGLVVVGFAAMRRRRRLAKRAR